MVLDLAYPGTSPQSAPFDKRTVVRSPSDLPIPVAGEIILKDNMQYLIVENITLNDSIVMGNNTILQGLNHALCKITYTNTGMMIKATNKSEVKIIDLALDCVAGTFMDVIGTGVETFSLSGVEVSRCDKIGTIDNVNVFVIQSCDFSDVVTNGILFKNTIGLIRYVNSISVLNGGTLFDLGTAVVNQLSFDATLNVIAAGTTFLDGLINSGNIATGGIGTVLNARFNGTGTRLNNISTNDALWHFFGSDDILDTRPDGLLHFSGAAAVTTITTVNTPVIINGTYLEDRSSQFDATAAGRLTYKGGKDTIVPITASITGKPASGSNKVFGFKVYINGVQTSHAVTNKIDATDNKNTALLWQVVLSTDDYVEIYVENQTDTQDFICESITFRIN